MTLREISTAACWLTIVASFVLSFSTWLALGQLAGFGVLAVALPCCVDGYVVTSLTTWLMPDVSVKLARFARGNLYAVGLVGVTAQAGYHGWLIAVGKPPGSPGAVLLATAVGMLPMAIATLAVHIRARAVRELAERKPAPAVLTEPATAPATAALASTSPPRPTSLSAPLRQPPRQYAPADSAPVQPTNHPAPDPVVQPAVRAVAPAPSRQPRPRPEVKESGSGPRREATVDDARKLVRDGLGRAAIAKRLGIGTGTARRLIDQVHAEDQLRLVRAP